MEQITQTMDQRFRATFEQAAVGMAHVAPDGRFVLVNQKLCDIVGYSRNELLRLTFQDITYPDDLEADLRYVQQLLAGTRKTYSMEKRYIRANGSLVWINLTVSLVCDERDIPQYFISVIEDINKRKRLEEELARERQALQMLTDNAPDIITRFDRSLRHLYINPAVTAATGQAPADIIGRTSEELNMPAEHVELWNTALRQVISTGEASSIEFSFDAPTGLHFYQSRLVPERDAGGEVTSVLSISRDVTDFKQAQAALEQALDALLKVAEVMVTHQESTSSRGQGIASYEETARQVLSPICQVLACRCAVLTKFLPDSDIIDMLVAVGFDRSVERTILKRVQGQAFSSHFEDSRIVEQLQRGEVITLDVSQPPYAQRQPDRSMHTTVLVPIRLGEELVGLLSLYPEDEQASYTPEERVLAVAIAKLAALLIERERLFTQRDVAETHVRTTQEVVRHMDEFLGIVSHELKTPLTTLQASLQLLKRQLSRQSQPESDDTKSTLPTPLSLLERAERQLKVQNRLINDLLDVSRIHSNRLELSPRLINLTQLVQDIIEDQRNLVPTRTIRLDTPPLEVLVFADADRVGQVINNYLSNALKYSDASCPVEVRISQDARTARVAVTDEGPGLTEQQQERIWQRFYRAPNIKVKSGSGVGLGLGLHICQTIIERQSGQVGVQSAPGRGSTFWFTLPLA